MHHPSLLALVACISIIASPILANPPAAAPSLPDIGAGLWLIGGGVDPPAIQQCLAGISSVHGCIHELISSFLGRQPQLLGPACCKAFMEIDGTCLPKMFPFHLDFLPHLKNNCGRGNDSPATPPPPPPPNDYDDDDEGGDYDYDV